MGLKDFVKGGGPSPNVGPRDPSLPAELMWLADAPLFIDEHRVEAFYDAMFRPDYDETEVILQKRVDRSTKVGANATVGAVFPGLLSKASIGLAGEHTRGRSSGQEAHYATVSNAYRNLLSLVLHYSTEPTKQSRLVLARTPITAFASENPAAVKDAAQLSDGTGQALDCTKLLPPSNYIRTPPRAMIMLDLDIGCKVIPAAVELGDGGVEQVFEDLARMAGEDPPDMASFPGDRLAKQNAYWKWYAENTTDDQAMKAIERTAKDQRIQWIAYRVSLNDDGGPYLHLTVSAKGLYETGVLAYNLIKRGAKHGLRIIGTLKSEPDVDVLAIFER